MLYLFAIILGILAGILAKGKISNLFDIRFKKPWLIIVAFAIQISAQITGFKGVESVSRYSFVIQSLVFTLLFIGFWINRRYLGLMVIWAGCAMNALVMMLNGGKMPVSYDLLVGEDLTYMVEALKKGVDGKHILADSSTKLIFLSDIFHPPSIFGYMMQVVSIGDIVVLVGLFILIFEVVWGKSFKYVNRKTTV